MEGDGGPVRGATVDVVEAPELCVGSERGARGGGEGGLVFVSEEGDEEEG